jgi:excinuclease UvrABC nuclease subunit
MANLPERPGAYRLTKNDSIIYVGSAKNLLERYSDWKNDPQNPCVKKRGWDKFVWQEASTHDAARKLELEWYNKYNPVCNVITPPGTA